MEAREFIILHHRGAVCVKAHSAAKALQNSCVPGGFRSVLAVIEAGLAVGTANTEPKQSGAPFLAIIGKPAIAAIT